MVCLFAIAHCIQLIRSAQAESLHLLLEELEELLKGHSPMMDAPTERVVDKAIKYGTVFAEVSSPDGSQWETDTV